MDKPYILGVTPSMENPHHNLPRYIDVPLTLWAVDNSSSKEWEIMEPVEFSKPGIAEKFRSLAESDKLVPILLGQDSNNCN
jgi:hypothetical protein